LLRSKGSGVTTNAAGLSGKRTMQTLRINPAGEEEYEHSSASFYYSEKSNYFQVVHFRENGEWVENKKSVK